MNCNKNNIQSSSNNQTNNPISYNPVSIPNLGTQTECMKKYVFYIIGLLLFIAIILIKK